MINRGVFIEPCGLTLPLQTELRQLFIKLYKLISTRILFDFCPSLLSSNHCCGLRSDWTF